jgi:hypothetical protein
MRRKLPILVLIFLLCQVIAFSQKAKETRVITGTVTSGNKKPVSNALIMIDNQKSTSITGPDGKFRVRVRKSNSRIGAFSTFYGIIEEDINGRQVINLAFNPEFSRRLNNPVDAEEEEAVKDANTYINVGYNYVKKKDIINQISVFEPGKQHKVYTSVYQMLTEIPGVSVIGGQINLSRARNLYGFIGPVIIVDGQERSIADILPSQVESIAVLRDASAAIFGTRAFGGAIVIKLKKIEY